MLLSVILSFASIYQTQRTYTYEHIWDSEVQGRFMEYPLYRPYNVIEEEVYIVNKGSHDVWIYFSGENIEQSEYRLSPYDELTLDYLNRNYRWINVGEPTEFQGTVEMRHTVTHYHEPYSLLSVIAFVLVFVGILVISKSYQEGFERVVRDIEHERMTEEVEEYTPPTENGGNNVGEE